MVEFKDYYQILGVDRKASDKDIKSAYRALARKYHPDTNKNDPGAEAKIKEINEAYEVLKDPEKRKRYDMLGANWKAGDNFRPPPDFGGGNFSFDFGNFQDLSKDGRFSDFFDVLFNQHFGNFGQGQAPGAAKRRNLDQEAEIELTIEELAHGTRRTLQVTAPHGKPRTIEVKIPKGVRAGKKVRVPGEGGTTGDGGNRGDLFLKIKVKPHHLFTIDGNNLVSEVAVSPAKAIIGGEATVDTIEGPVKIRIPAGTQNGRMLRLKGKGLPILNESVPGDQLVRTRIVIPTQLSEQEKALYEELAKLENKKPG